MLAHPAGPACAQPRAAALSMPSASGIRLTEQRARWTIPPGRAEAGCGLRRGGTVAAAVRAAHVHTAARDRGVAFKLMARMWRRARARLTIKTRNVGQWIQPDRGSGLYRRTSRDLDMWRNYTGNCNSLWAPRSLQSTGRYPGRICTCRACCTGSRSRTRKLGQPYPMCCTVGSKDCQRELQQQSRWRC